MIINVIVCLLGMCYNSIIKKLSVRIKQENTVKKSQNLSSEKAKQLKLKGGD